MTETATTAATATATDFGAAEPFLWVIAFIGFILVIKWFFGAFKTSSKWRLF